MNIWPVFLWIIAFKEFLLFSGTFQGFFIGCFLILLTFCQNFDEFLEFAKVFMSFVLKSDHFFFNSSLYCFFDLKHFFEFLLENPVSLHFLDVVKDVESYFEILIFEITLFFTGFLFRVFKELESVPLRQVPKSLIEYEGGPQSALV